MEKIKLVLACMLLSGAFSLAAVFGEEGDGAVPDASEPQGQNTAMPDASGDTGGGAGAGSGTGTSGAGGGQVAIGNTRNNQNTTNNRTTQNAAAKTPTFTVTFDAGEGVKAPPPLSIGKDATLGESLPSDLEKEGYDFLGWFTGTEGKGEKVGEGYQVTENITFYAYWKLREYTVTFDGSRDNSHAQQKFIVNHGENLASRDLSKLSEMLKWRGHNFLGWKTEEGIEFDENVPIVQDMTFYADWEKVPSILEKAWNHRITLAGVFLFLALIAFVILAHIRVSNLQKKVLENQNAFKQELLAALDKKNSEIDEQLVNLRAKIGSASNAKSDDNSAEIAKIKQRLDNLEQTKPSEFVQSQPKTVNTSGDPRDVFDAWAANPSPATLPMGVFMYIEGDMSIRTKRELIESQAETMWITNRAGTKYLFPNPCLFNSMTNIAAFYKMDMARLKPKGQNKVRVIKPCEMSNEGFVEFPGELEIL